MLQVKQIYLTHEQFTIDNGLLTPTMKAKRPQLRQKYEDVIRKMYADNPTSNDK
jgi:long-chain acyl-CoA synthetase